MIKVDLHALHLVDFLEDVVCDDSFKHLLYDWALKHESLAFYIKHTIRNPIIYSIYKELNHDKH